ncbi:MAG: NAD(P)/FAD-dependent oxidoreductase [Patescibacteria group bacterium]
MVPIRIVVLGSGFGGVYAYRRLAKLLRGHQNHELTLVSRDNYFLFSPMLHEVATGGLNRHDIVQPIRQIVRVGEGKFLKATVTGINAELQTVQTDMCSLPYDYLVVALGAETRFSDIPGAKEFTLGLKTMRDAVCIRNRALKLLEAASVTKDSGEQERLLRWVVVGGGPTGVELAPELVDLANAYARSSPECPIEKLDVQLYHAGSSLLPQFGVRTSNYVSRLLRLKRITVHLTTAIESVAENSIQVKNSVIPVGLVAWTAGISPITVPITPLPERGTTGRIIVSPTLLVPNTKNVFVVGDLAGVDAPQTAQAAVEQAKVAAMNIVALINRTTLQGYSYKEQGLLVSLGQWKAAGTVYGYFISGAFAWWLWRTVYLSKLVGTANKIRVAIDWTLNLFYTRDTSEV